MQRDRTTLLGQKSEGRVTAHLHGRRGWRFLLAGLLVALSLSAAAAADAAGRRDQLWGIVSNCLDRRAADYCAVCTAPLADAGCAAQLSCGETTEVWAETRDFVALRDRKMCDCPQGFVHGLAIPRSRVSGVEDPRRPDGIWGFAWKLAAQKIGNESLAALAVNPAAFRSQDQLHVHIVRLQKDARSRFAAARNARVQRPEEVWGAAGRMAAAAGLADYGVLVARHPEGGFIVLVDPTSPEKDYTEERCRRGSISIPSSLR